jgi:hypothetical protein
MKVIDTPTAITANCDKLYEHLITTDAELPSMNSAKSKDHWVLRLH